MITIGTVLKPQGIKGEIKVLPITDDARRFLELKEVLINNTSFVVSSVRLHERFAYVKLKGINDRNAAEALVGKDLSIKRDAAVKLPEGRYFIEDLLHAEVFLGTQSLGVVTSIDNFGSADVYTVRGARTVRFPLLKKLIVRISAEDKRIELDPDVFGEVAVYED